MLYLYLLLSYLQANLAQETFSYIYCVNHYYSYYIYHLEKHKMALLILMCIWKYIMN